MSAAGQMDVQWATRSLPEHERPGKYIGSPVQRTEDEALLRGLGQYVDDLKLEGALHAAVSEVLTLTPKFSPSIPLLHA